MYQRFVMASEWGTGLTLRQWIHHAVIDVDDNALIPPKTRIMDKMIWLLITAIFVFFLGLTVFLPARRVITHRLVCRGSGLTPSL